MRKNVIVFLFKISIDFDDFTSPLTLQSVFVLIEKLYQTIETLFPRLSKDFSRISPKILHCTSFIQISSVCATFQKRVMRVITTEGKHGDVTGVCDRGCDGEYGDWIANSRVDKQGF